MERKKGTYYDRHRTACLAAMHKYRDANHEKVLAAKRLQNKINRGEINRKAKLYRENNPEKTECHRIMWRAIRAGELVVGDCEGCPATPEDTKIQGHHNDYSKPLDVTWFCRPCHGRHHRGTLVFRKGCMTSEKLQELIG